jgi:hypothetical protein
MKFNANKLATISVALTISLFCVSRSSGRIHNVFPDGSGEYENIQAAIDAAIDGDTVMLADGQFAGRGNINLKYYGKAILVCSESGNQENCLINIEGEFNEEAERGFIFESNETPSSILKDLTIINGNADGPCPACEGAGIYVHYSSPTIINVICRDNYASNGAGIMCVGGAPIIQNCRFINNTGFDGSGIMCLDSSRATFSHCLIADNHADLRGGGISLQAFCNVTMTNCTISNNDATQGAGIAAWESDYYIENCIIAGNDTGASVYAYGESNLDIVYTDIFGNAGGDWIDIIYDQYGIFGNISLNPEFASESTGDYHLTVDSPCIDAGNPESPRDPDSTIADLGAYYYDQQSAVIDNPNIPSTFWLGQNYPNPFNAGTSIEFQINSKSHVTLEIYDLSGRLIAAPADGFFEAGHYRMVWRPDIPSGVYYYAFKCGAELAVKKMILLK